MDIILKEIAVRDVVKNYCNNAEDGVVGFDKLLNVRPKYQREFIYKDQQRDAVIETVRKDFPLNVMYWAKNSDGTYEVMDGQQRTISICDYVTKKYAINFQYFHNLDEEQKNQILNYKLMVYICEGSENEKLEWFKTINIAGEKLTEQELRNAVYTGRWLSDAKRYFSKNQCQAFKLASDYMTGNPIRQDYLETVIDWISDGHINMYMANHQNDVNANELWFYFSSVINWVKTLFPNTRKEMKSVQWGSLYNKYKDKSYDSDELEVKIKNLMQDDDVTKKSGIYTYLLSGEEKYLSVRAFTQNNKREAYEKQNGICTHCGGHFDLSEMEADHITPWHLGGKTVSSNCQMLCKNCNRTKSGI